jgi:hypothetical protein
MIEKTKDLLTSIARAEMMFDAPLDSAIVVQIDRLITEFLALGIPLRPLPIFAAICEEGGTDEDAVTAAIMIERRLAEVGHVADREPTPRSARSSATLGTVGPCEVESSSVEGG